MSEFQSEMWLHFRRYLNVAAELILNSVVVVVLFSSFSAFRHLIGIIFGDNPKPFVQLLLQIMLYANDALGVALLIAFGAKAVLSIYKTVREDVSAVRRSSNE